ncbi:hypothetical protein GGQ97_001570 [Sphingomonas kaistensis]|uniref:Sacsin/Nov domain-containing protein n=1 Tax=Sphingomonas kaistensis TaxID=298708 RepID=A0A7X5Y730_9SPHN|nr:hypothetical protein [Sphingomonas kaistensis]NJC05777.1 hypothetical protein [Sphingomonas kaistensis]
MTAYRTTPVSIVEDLQNLLRDRYKSGFPVLKELLQNADDAGAQRLLVCAHAGFQNASNPLLRAPSLIIANDGLVTADHFAAMEKASGGSKGGDAAAVGRFGLGQKAVFHLCDAFVALAWIDSTPAFKVMNPWEEISEAAGTSDAWKHLQASDQKQLVSWAADNGLNGRGMLLVVPLRTSTLCPADGLWLTPQKWTPEHALADMISGEELAPALCCLRTIAIIEFVSLEGVKRLVTIASGASRLSGPDESGPARKLHGSWTDSASQGVRFFGQETWCPGGVAFREKAAEDWPFSHNYRQQRVAAKAEPHGAVIICRSPAVGTAGQLRLRSTVYLPVATIAEAPIAAAAGNVDILLHGYFFVSTSRTQILTTSEAGAEGRWNTALEAEATLPQVLPALADVLPTFGSDDERETVLKALAGTSWWAQKRSAVCRSDALSYVWNGVGGAGWRIVPAAAIRPLPIRSTTPWKLLSAVFPGISDWCAERQTFLAAGPILAAEDCSWTDEELASLVSLAGENAFTHARTAETISSILSSVEVGPLTRDAIALALRTALLGSSRLAPATAARKLLPFLTKHSILPLPASVTNRPLIAALAATGEILPIPADWEAPSPDSKFSSELAVNLLSAAAKFVGDKVAADQAAALITAILRLAPPLRELAMHPTGAKLAIVPVTRVLDRRDLVLSLEEAEQIGAQGFLFDGSPNRGKDLLASAVLEPPTYRLRWQSGGDAVGASSSHISNLLKPLRAAREYGLPEARGELANFLRDEADLSDLRRLCAGDADLPSTAFLVALDRGSSALDDLLTSLLTQRSAVTRALPLDLLERLTRSLKDKIGIESVDVQTLGQWLIEARKDHRLPEISQSTAIALLTSGIKDDVLSQLPVHRTTTGARVSVADGLRRAPKGTVPESLVAHALLLDPWNDPQTLSIEQRLVPTWSEIDQINVALATDTPHIHFDALVASIAEADLTPDIVSALGTARWIPFSTRAVSPGEVLDLHEEVDQTLSAFLGDKLEFPTISRLPQKLQSVLAKLRDAALFPSTAVSLQLASELAKEAGAVGVGPIAASISHWRTLALAKQGVPCSGWPFLAAALRTTEDDAASIELANKLLAPAKEQVGDLLQALAELSGSYEAARAIHLSIFERHGVTLKVGEFVSPDLLLPSVEGTFARADSLALTATGVASGSLLNSTYKRILYGDEHLPLATLGELHAPARGQSSLSEVLEPLRGYCPEEAVLFLLAMLGCDGAVAKVAEAWPAQRTFEAIRDDLISLESLLDRNPGEIADRLAELRFEIVVNHDAQAEVLSVAGASIRVPLDELPRSWLIDCHALEKDRACPQRVMHPFRLSLVPLSINDESEVRPLLEQFVRKLAPALMLPFVVHGDTLVEQLGSYFRHDQTTLEQTCEDLRRVLDFALQGLKKSEATRTALRAFQDTKRKDLDRAQRDLWAFLESEVGSQEVLRSVRQKIEELGYTDGRVLFELFQNADDALRYWRGAGSAGRFHAELERDENGRISTLRVVHWGRPINHPGHPPEEGLRREHDRDLSNMLAIGHSAKEGDGQTGRFGLGFKTVHMLSDSPRLASGSISACIRGGMIPVEWKEGRTLASRHGARGEKPTLIELPIAAHCAESAEKAWQEFQATAPWLVAVAPRIHRIEIGENETHECTSRLLAPGIEMITLAGPAGRNALRIELCDFRLFLGVGRAGPEPIREVRQFWHLVPLDGQDRHGDWVMDGPFPVDPGRSHFAGAVEGHDELFSNLGVVLGERLVELFDTVEANWLDFAAAEKLDEDSRLPFWRKLIEVFARDVQSGGAERHLHKDGGGVGCLLLARPLVPVLDGTNVCAGEVRWRLTGALASQDLFAVISEWPAFLAVAPKMVNEETARLLELLGLSRPLPFKLIDLLQLMLRDGPVTPEIASLLGSALHSESLQRIEFNEQQELRSALRETSFVAQDDTLQPIRALGFLNGDPAEALRAAFAPPSGQLSGLYTGPALELAKLAREQAGGRDDILRRWVATAGSDKKRTRAFLTYLATVDALSIRRLADAAKAWMPQGEALLTWEELDDIPGRESILAALGAWQGPSLPPPSDNPYFSTVDAAAALERIAEWWNQERNELSLAYDRSTYPEGFNFSELAEENDEAWFTMLALATFQTIGRVGRAQSRSFVEKATRDGWWRDLSSVQQTEDLTPFIDRLREWSDPWQDPSFAPWRRCLVDLCTVSRYLSEYRRLFLTLPRALAKEGDISLGTLLTPHRSAVAAKMGIVAAPIAPSLGIGANWLVRELSRKGIYDEAQATRALPYGWSTARRVRTLFRRLDLGMSEHGVDAGRALHERVADLIGDDPARFGGDGDLPLHLITTSDHREIREEILLDAGAAYEIDLSDD